MTSTALKIEQREQIEQIEQREQTERFDQREQVAEADRTGEYHSVLAMEAARKMRRTQKKRETGQTVCHHLKMMLASEPVPVCPVSELKVTVNPNGHTPRPLHSEPQFTLGL